MLQLSDCVKKSIHYIHDRNRKKILPAGWKKVEFVYDCKLKSPKVLRLVRVYVCHVAVDGVCHTDHSI